MKKSSRPCPYSFTIENVIFASNWSNLFKTPTIEQQSKPTNLLPSQSATRSHYEKVVTCLHSVLLPWPSPRNPSKDLETNIQSPNRVWTAAYTINPPLSRRMHEQSLEPNQSARSRREADSRNALRRGLGRNIESKNGTRSWSAWMPWLRRIYSGWRTHGTRNFGFVLGAEVWELGKNLSRRLSRSWSDV